MNMMSWLLCLSPASTYTHLPFGFSIVDASVILKIRREDVLVVKRVEPFVLQAIFYTWRNLDIAQIPEIEGRCISCPKRKHCRGQRTIKLHFYTVHAGCNSSGVVYHESIDPTQRRLLWVRFNGTTTMAIATTRTCFQSNSVCEY